MLAEKKYILNVCFFFNNIEINKSILNETIKVTEFIKKKHHTENNNYFSFTKISEI